MADMPSCKYHPTDAALWFCQTCETAFCAHCVPADQDNYLPKCTLCRRSLRSLSIAKQIEPFWQKLGDFFSAPLSRVALAMMSLFAILIALLPSNIFGPLLFVLLLLPLTEFLFEIMENRASGDAHKRKLSEYLTLKNKSMFGKLLLIYVLLAILLSKISGLMGAATGYSIAAFFVLGAPASLIILMMEKSMLGMLNPIKILFMMRIFGKAYFFLYAFIGVILLVAFSLHQGGSARSSILPLNFCANFIVIYGVMVLFSMMGYLVYQHHQELNFSINRQMLHTQARATPTDAMVEVDIFIQEGRFEDAQSLLLKKIEVKPDDYRAREKLILLYAIGGKEVFLNKVLDAYFNNLLAQGKPKQAADFYAKLSAKEINIELRDEAVVLALLPSLSNKQQFKLGLKLLENFKLEPGAEKVWDELAYYKAKILTEYLEDFASATTILRLILKRSLNQELLAPAEKLVAVLDV